MNVARIQVPGEAILLFLFTLTVSTWNAKQTLRRVAAIATCRPQGVGSVGSDGSVVSIHVCMVNKYLPMHLYLEQFYSNIPKVCRMHNSFSVGLSRSTTDGWCGQQQQEQQLCIRSFDCELPNLVISHSSRLFSTPWSRSRISITTSRRDGNVAQVPQLSWNIVSCLTGSCARNHNPYSHSEAYFSKLAAAARWVQEVCIILTLHSQHIISSYVN